jgi:26S proteasome regulatory subunit N9
VNATYYRVAADYHKVGKQIAYNYVETMCQRILQAKADYAPYYRNSLLFLACVDIEQDMNRQERIMRAHDLSISALLGDTIYNFGELVGCLILIWSFIANLCKTKLLHPILDVLDGTPHEWIKKLLFTFNEGNIGKFEALAPVFPKEVNNFNCTVNYTAG